MYVEWCENFYFLFHGFLLLNWSYEYNSTLVYFTVHYILIFTQDFVSCAVEKLLHNENCVFMLE